MVENHAPRSFQPGSRDMVEMFSAGRPVLEHIRAAVACEKPDGMFFCTAGGSLFFLAADHRTKSPYTRLRSPSETRERRGRCRT